MGMEDSLNDREQADNKLEKSAYVTLPPILDKRCEQHVELMWSGSQNET